MSDKILVPQIKNNFEITEINPTIITVASILIIT